jgi:alkylated DNA repair dioxygenase AlkB
MVDQLGLFGGATDFPAGFRYERHLLSRDEASGLLERIRGLPFREFEFQGYVGKRRVVSFGWRYDFNERRLTEAAAIPSFLEPLRQRAARFAARQPEDLAQALVTEYEVGAAIGWHRDKAEFGDVVGVSLGSPCTFRFRRRAGARWERVSLTLEPRSAYLLRGPSRTEWEHSIPAVDALRYSITFRTLRRGSRDVSE